MRGVKFVGAGLVVGALFGFAAGGFFPNGRQRVDSPGRAVVHVDEPGVLTIWAEGTGRTTDDIRAPDVIVTDPHDRPVVVRTVSTPARERVNSSIAVAMYEFDTTPGDYHVDVDVLDPPVGAAAVTAAGTTGNPVATTKDLVPLDAVSVGAGSDAALKRIAIGVAIGAVLYVIGWFFFNRYWRRRPGAARTPDQAFDAWWFKKPQMPAPIAPGLGPGPAPAAPPPASPAPATGPVAPLIPSEPDPPHYMT